MGDDIEHPLVRIAGALENIAVSLEKIANPAVAVSSADTKITGCLPIMPAFNPR